ncbi:MAG: two-component system response regulator [Sandaracinaceae bacterium]
MGKLARISLSTSRLRLGVGVHGRLVRQALRQYADPRTTNRLFLTALEQASLEDVPESREPFLAFLESALLPVIEAQLGEVARRAVSDEVTRVLQDDEAPPSEVRRRPVRVIAVGLEDERFVGLGREVGEHEMLRAPDLVGAATMMIPGSLTVLVVGSAVPTPPAVLRMIQGLAGKQARIVQWGGGAPLVIPAGLRWERVDPTVEPAEVARRGLAEHWSRSAAGAATIAVADDDDEYRAAMARRLTAEGYNVIAVRDGAALLEACLDHRPALVLSDFDMPALNGAQVAALLSQKLGKAAPPFILVSSTDVDARDHAGVVGVIAKTTAHDVIVRRAVRLLNRVRTS